MTFPLQIQICFILPYNQIIKTNNQIIKMNNQIFKITVLRIRPRLTDVGSNFVKRCGLAFDPPCSTITAYGMVSTVLISPSLKSGSWSPRVTITRKNQKPCLWQ